MIGFALGASDLAMSAMVSCARHFSGDDASWYRECAPAHEHHGRCNQFAQIGLGCEIAKTDGSHGCDGPVGWRTLPERRAQVALAENSPRLGAISAF